MKNILWPFAFLFQVITSIRNFLYGKGYLKSFKFDLPAIGVGNLTVGGTGKTPHVEYIVRLLKDNYKIAVLSRGYGRKSKGFVMATENTYADQIGDEPRQYFQKFQDDVVVCVGEQRIMAIPTLLKEKPGTELIILDDVYQHRQIQTSLMILLTDYKRLFYKDNILPVGRLRENKTAADRADVIVVTKCPEELSEHEQKEIFSKIKKFSKPNTPVFFSTIKYASPEPIFEKSHIWSNKIILVSGIASPQYLHDVLSKKYQILRTIDFKDHHSYSTHDISRIVSLYKDLNSEAVVLTTEKDMVKLQHYKTELQEIPIFYQPIEIEFLKGKQEFDSIIFDNIKQ